MDNSRAVLHFLLNASYLMAEKTTRAGFGHSLFFARIHLVVFFYYSCFLVCVFVTCLPRDYAVFFQFFVALILAFSFIVVSVCFSFAVNLPFFTAFLTTFSFCFC